MQFSVGGWRGGGELIPGEQVEEEGEEGFNLCQRVQ